MGSSRGANGGPQAMEQAWKHALRIFSIDVRFALNISANSMDELAFNFSQERQKLTFPYISSLPKKYPGQGGYVAGLRTLSNHFEVTHESGAVDSGGTLARPVHRPVLPRQPVFDVLMLRRSLRNNYAVQFDGFFAAIELS